MKLSSDTWRVRWNDDTIFYSYRWLAWALAGLALMLPDQPRSDLPRDAGLLLLLGVITVAATAMAQSYVRLARRRPIILLLDLLVGIVVIWLSGGNTLPFLPYALGALVLPALLNGWTGAILAAGTFALFDVIGLITLPLAPTSPPSLGLRALIPLAFAALWVLLKHVLQDSNLSIAPGMRQRPPITIPSHDTQPNQALRLSNFENLNTGATVGASMLIRQSSPPAQTEPASRADAARPAIFDPAPAESLTFPAAIEQLAIQIGRQGSAEPRTSTTGYLRPLTGAQHSVLLRVAQEALLNVQQHAHAHIVQVTIAYEPKAITLSIQDDGVGLLDGTYERPGMHSLRAVRYRLAELDGQFAVFESESGGVTVRATLPLD